MEQAQSDVISQPRLGIPALQGGEDVNDPEYLTADSDIGPLVEEGKLVREVADTDPMGPTAGRRSNRSPM